MSKQKTAQHQLDAKNRLQLPNKTSSVHYSNIKTDIKFYNDSLNLKSSVRRRGYSQLDAASVSSLGKTLDEQQQSVVIAKQTDTTNSNTSIPSTQSYSTYLPNTPPHSNRESIADDDVDSERKKLLQLYILVARCIAYPFNVRSPSDISRRKAKVTKKVLSVLRGRFGAFLDGKTNMTSDDDFKRAIQVYADTILWSESVAKMINSGSYSEDDFRDHFKYSIEEDVCGLRNVEGVSKETVLALWMARFDVIFRGDMDDETISHENLEANSHSELLLSKEELLNMFRRILGVVEYEHQLVFNACKLDNDDEQLSCIRKELESRKEAILNPPAEVLPHFIEDNMKEIFVKEKKTQWKQMMTSQHDVFPNNRSRLECHENLHDNNVFRDEATLTTIGEDDHHGNGSSLQKILASLFFKLQVTVIEASGISRLPKDRRLFVVIKFKGNEKLRTELVEADKPTWETSFDWSTNHPLPHLTLKLKLEDSPLRMYKGKSIAKLSLNPHCGLTEDHKWYTMDSCKGWTDDEIKIQLSIRTERPYLVKKSGFLFSKGSKLWKTWEKRYFVLVEVGQSNFVLCSYRIKTKETQGTMPVNGYTVDFAVTSDEYDGRCFFFKLTKGNDEVIFAAEKDSERRYWFRKFYQTTGQQKSPILSARRNSKRRLTLAPGFDENFEDDSIDDLVTADVFSFNQSELFSTLQRLTLAYRLNDSYTCMGWFSSGQAFLLDEYASRYDIRGCHRHLCYLEDLLDTAESSITIDPTLMHNSYAFCASHVLRPDGVHTVTVDERDRFDEMKNRLRSFLTNQITHFRDSFPFGRPEGALKSMLALFERVMSEDPTSSYYIATQTNDRVNEAVRTCLNNAALVNYSSISRFAKVQESYHQDATWTEKVAITIQLAELCIELVQQNDEYHSEAFSEYRELMIEHLELFWSMFAADMENALGHHQDTECWDTLQLFKILNNYLKTTSDLNGGKFHQHLTNILGPVVNGYLNHLESSLQRAIEECFQRENYKSAGKGCATSEIIFKQIQSTQEQIHELQWPAEQQEMEAMAIRLASDTIEAIVRRVLEDFGKLMGGSISAEYLVPDEACVMINVLYQAHEEVKHDRQVEQCNSRLVKLIEATQKHTIDMITGRLCIMLQDLLKELTRFDLSDVVTTNTANVSTSEKNKHDIFCHLIALNTHQVKENVFYKIYLCQFEKALWEKTCTMIRGWLIERNSKTLYAYQSKVLKTVVEVCRNIFQNGGLSDFDMHTETYEDLYTRLYG